MKQHSIHLFFMAIVTSAQPNLADVSPQYLHHYQGTDSTDLECPKPQEIVSADDMCIVQLQRQEEENDAYYACALQDIHRQLVQTRQNLILASVDVDNMRIERGQAAKLIETLQKEVTWSKQALEVSIQEKKQVRATCELLEDERANLAQQLLKSQHLLKNYIRIAHNYRVQLEGSRRDLEVSRQVLQEVQDMHQQINCDQLKKRLQIDRDLSEAKMTIALLKRALKKSKRRTRRERASRRRMLAQLVEQQDTQSGAFDSAAYIMCLQDRINQLQQ